MGEHNHSHTATGRRGKLAVVFAITATIMVAEIIGAVVSGSLAPVSYTHLTLPTILLV